MEFLQALSSFLSLEGTTLVSHFAPGAAALWSAASLWVGPTNKAPSPRARKDTKDSVWDTSYSSSLETRTRRPSPESPSQRPTQTTLIKEWGLSDVTLVGDGRPGARQRETLHRRSSSPHSSDCAPRAPENPGSHCSRGGSPRPEMLSRVSGWGDPRAAVLHPRVPTALPRHPPPIYAAPVLFASLEVGNMGVQGPKSRKRRASQSFLGPETKYPSH